MLELKPLPQIDRKLIYHILHFYEISQTTVAKIHKTTPQAIHNALTNDNYKKHLLKYTKTILRLANKKVGANFIIEQFYKTK